MKLVRVSVPVQCLALNGVFKTDRAQLRKSCRGSSERELAVGQRADARAGAERSRCWGGREFRSQIDLETRATEATNQHLRDFAAAALPGHGLGVRPTGRHDVIALELGTMRVHVVTFDAGGEGEGEPEILRERAVEWGNICVESPEANARGGIVTLRDKEGHIATMTVASYSDISGRIEREVKRVARARGVAAVSWRSNMW